MRAGAIGLLRGLTIHFATLHVFLIALLGWLFEGALGAEAVLVKQITELTWPISESHAGNCNGQEKHGLQGFLEHLVIPLYWPEIGRRQNIKARPCGWPAGLLLLRVAFAADLSPCDISG